MKNVKVFFFLLLFTNVALADEGMWMLPYIEKLNIQKMNGMGCTLSAEDIYSDKNVSLKDAVIVFGNGCTGVVVSNQGLVFTNHHCGFNAIQQHSTVEHNYLNNGFTALRLEDEIPSPGLTVKFLVSITDVTEKVISQLPDSLMGEKRKSKQDSLLRALNKEFKTDSLYTVQTKSFYAGNEFYVFVYQEFQDVRFAYAPPSSIGKFGGDTDNWMWPRHTGDFSVFRVYSDKNGKPAPYSKENIPYSPKKFVPISNKGYETGDFAMIMGNPGTTTRYLSSWGIINRVNNSNQARIDVRGAKQDVWKTYMRSDEAIKIAYASKYARSSNYWKNSIGMNTAVAKLAIVQRKKDTEATFSNWVNKTDKRRLKYSKVLADLEKGYTLIKPYSHALNYLRESLQGGAEMPRIASQLSKLMENKISNDSILKSAKKWYKDYYQQVDEVSFNAMLQTYQKYVEPQYQPGLFTIISKKYRGNTEKYTRSIYSKSVFSSFEKFQKAIQQGAKNLINDPAVMYWRELNLFSGSLQKGDYEKGVALIENAERLFQAGYKEIYSQKGISSYPDANFTMRMTYGKIEGYQPADAVSYKYYTSTQGVLEKEKAGDEEFDVPEKLKSSIEKSNYGAYIDSKTGNMHVAFLSTNDITGGNSGSPIFNAKGELLGLAFDGNWEAMSGDIVFEPDLQRTINVDVRYILFVMDKVGGATRLIEELKIN
ncbi:MAG: hypothetical protein AUK44_08560 [Porphyromonadaceae bacterium CG2_30_38_12]|nr:MAG: hypothetical protein AUK44_08560 [Porphyromonadaceae bacterium CG2_30_38_12]